MPRRKLGRGALLVIAASVALTVSACGSDDKSGGGSASAGKDNPAAADKPIGIVKGTRYETVGPNGEKPTPVADLSLSDADVAKVKAGHHRVALLWHTSSADQESVTAGAKSVFDKYGISVVGVGAGDFDPAKQASQVQTMMARKPDMMLAVPVDPDASAEAFRPAADKGVKIVFSSVVPKGFTAGKDYVGLVNGDLAGMGKQAAEMLGKSLGGKGKVGLVYYDANFFATNTRDVAFRSWMRKLYPDVEIVSQGMADPAKGQETAAAMLAQHPDLDGVYVTWAAPPAQGVIAALRSSGKTGTKLVTFDLDPAIDLDMIKGDYVIGEVVNPPFNLGAAMAKLAVHSLLNDKSPDFVVTPGVSVTADNLAEVWKQSTGAEPPAEITKALADR
jgi:ribose transport system substrate-binding protein